MNRNQPKVIILPFAVTKEDLIKALKLIEATEEPAQPLELEAEQAVKELIANVP